jgi:Tfp pilus assembly protein PilV
MVSLFILSIGIAGLAAVFAGSIRTATMSGHRNEAVTLAVRDVESIRAIPYGELGFATSVAGYAPTFTDGANVFNTVTVPYSQLTPAPSPTVFRGESFQVSRSIYWVDRNGAPGSVYKRATVSVQWTDPAGTHAVRQDTDLYPGGLGPAVSTSTTVAAAGVTSAPTLTAAANVASPSSAINLSWTAASGSAQTLWRVQLSVDNFLTPHSLVDVPAAVLSYRATGLAAGTTYQFRVGAINGSQAPVWSSVGTLATATGGATGPCQMLSERITPSTLTRDSVTHKLPSSPAIAIQVATSGNCVALSLRYQPSGGTSQVTSLAPNSTATTWTANLPTTSPWDLGNHVIAVWDDVANAPFSGCAGITVS